MCPGAYVFFPWRLHAKRKTRCAWVKSRSVPGLTLFFSFAAGKRDYSGTGSRAAASGLRIQLGEQPWRDIPVLSALGNDRDALFVVARKRSGQLGVTGRMERHFFSNPEIQHLGMRPHLAAISEPDAVAFRDAGFPDGTSLFLQSGNPASRNATASGSEIAAAPRSCDSAPPVHPRRVRRYRSEEHTSELQSR